MEPPDDSPFSVEAFKQGFAVSVRSSSACEVELEMRGIDAPIINALRRIVIDEVPTIAVDKVVMYQNTSPLADEVVAHRLGLVPIMADPDCLALKGEDEEFTEENALRFYLKATGPTTGSAEVLADSMQWEPIGSQELRFPGGFRPLHGAIPLVKLGPGQEIEFEVYCTKGIGARHTKWSPVCTAYYKLFPGVALTTPVVGAEAEELVRLCPGVFAVESVGKKGEKRAVVVAPELSDVCRPYLAHPHLGPKIDLYRERGRYIFVIESVGVLAPLRILSTAIDILRNKAQMYMAILQPSS